MTASASSEYMRGVHDEHERIIEILRGGADYDERGNASLVDAIESAIESDGK